jgi:hypothetical protein
VTSTSSSPWHNTVICGDVLEILPYVPSNTAALTIFSPSLEEMNNYGAGPRALHRRLATQLLRVTTDSGACALTIDSRVKFKPSLSMMNVITDWTRLGWKLFECRLDRNAKSTTGWWPRQWPHDHKHLLLLYKGRAVRQLGDEAASSGSLAADLIRRFTGPGDFVIDPRCGGGATGVMAVRAGRYFLGIDASETRCALARQRLKSEVGFVGAVVSDDPTWRF